MNNKLLERELQTSISNLKNSELKKMLSFYEHFTSTLVQKAFSSTPPSIQKKTPSATNAKSSSNTTPARATDAPKSRPSPTP